MVDLGVFHLTLLLHNQLILLLFLFLFVHFAHVDEAIFDELVFFELDILFGLLGSIEELFEIYVSAFTFSLFFHLLVIFLILDLKGQNVVVGWCPFCQSTVTWILCQLFT